MSPVKSDHKYTWLKNILKLLLMIAITLIVILLVSSLVMNNTEMFNVDFQTWFYETRLGWFLWRILLYIIVLVLMFRVNKQVSLSLKAKLLIASSIILIEGLNLFYLRA
ncbi:TPA: hypothetical protein RNX34_002154 [Pasteurella multocida]|uniref:hypothetical protein n=1 Tax=Pasteurella multocida TaxID=747 RepID=UPI001093C491|nr:hypothetical protein [Pasteurella multocida]QCA32160.1 hypothetical protein E5U06_09665 [Pasteurella multocida]QXG51768.1 hypothetical protein KSF84_01485 [Pasteurella multocida]HDX0990420.1 hypothetical protein [Pasteurella multocida]HDX1015687.1 hypothetical protein [Pasteurella multocida]HDX1025321.1 hypothetical protein [Pasteurella multocida]